MRVVLDTNILVRASPKVSPQGLARDLLLTIVSGPHVLIVSPAVLVEVQRVLTYPHVQARGPLTKDAIEQYLVFLEAAGVLVDLPKVSPAVVSDPDDDPILQTAIAGRAEVLARAMKPFDTKLSSKSAPRTAFKISGRYYLAPRASPVEHFVDDVAHRRVAYGSPPASDAGIETAIRLPHLPRNRHYRLPHQSRAYRGGATHSRALTCGEKNSMNKQTTSGRDRQTPECECGSRLYHQGRDRH